MEQPTKGPYPILRYSAKQSIMEALGFELECKESSTRWGLKESGNQGAAPLECLPE